MGPRLGALASTMRAGTVSNRIRSASRLTRAAALILGVSSTGGQACGGGDGATEPTPTAAGTFTLSAAPATVPILQGGGGESTIAIVRSGGFTGSVALAVTGAPVGLTATISPSSAAGTTATLIVTTVATVAASSVTLTITGTAAGQSDQTTTATVAITPSTGGTGNVTLDFSACPATSRPTWFVYQDGAGAWTQIIGSADVYRFNVASDKGGYAFVSQGSGRTLTVSLATQAELAGSTISRCDLRSVGPKRLSGTVTGLGPGDVAYLGMGGPNPDPEGGPIATSFILTGIQDGNQDLIAYRSNPSAFGPRERVIIRRDQDIANNGTLGTIDFDAAESFAPATATVTVTGTGSAQVGHYMAYYAGTGCSYYDLYGHSNSGVDFTMRGIPGAQQRATDFHWITVYAPDFSRYAVESFHTLADRSIAFPAPLPAPTITTPPGGHKRLQAALTLPSEYHTSLSLWLFLGDGVGANVSASFGWLGEATATLSLPDFSAVTGWSRSFLPTSGEPVGWFLAARGANSAAAGGPCAENARFVSAYVSGRQ